eukprot:TRINITY_DN1822_c0_g2_i2.p1 TRINITY_DN1822_c0_g2~~TRINITY_DN1822_c0_g2_i2.p1  ORF type:complete len:651 (+),score=102.26 TRINITY_DN1822_c0_g2_i2:317-2269(+)
MAVIFVVLFHLGVPGIKGGFVGVDIFFVISGYLVIGSMLKQCLAGKESNALDFGTFLARRIKRLLIPSSTCLLFVLVTALLFDPTDYWYSSFGDIAYSAFHVVNLWWLSQATGYFAPDSQFSLVLHFWSLSLEEQFYFLFPIAWILFAYVMNHRLNRLITKTEAKIFIAVCFVLSIIPCLALSMGMSFSKIIFYLTPVRLWEFLAGALVFLFEEDIPADKIPFWVPLLPLTGLFIGGVLISSDGWPNLYTLLVVFLTSLVILCQKRKLPSPFRYFVYIGDWSYSIYLYHWPVIRFLWPLFLRLDFPHKTFLFYQSTLSLSVFLALLSYYWVEQTSAKLNLKPRVWFLLFLIVSVSVGGGAIGAKYYSLAHYETRTGMSLPEPLPLEHRQDLSWVEPWQLTVLKDHLFHLQDGNPRTEFGYGKEYQGFIVNGTGTKCVGLIGDSHAEMWFPLVHHIGNLHNASFFFQYVIRKGEVTNPSPYLWEQNFPNTRSLEDLSRCSSTLLFMAGLTNNNAVNEVDNYHRAIREWSTLVPNSCLTIVEDTPSWDYSRRDGPLTCLLSDTPLHECNKNVTEMVENWESKNLGPFVNDSRVAVVNFQKQLCPSGTCFANRADYIIWYDTDHMTSRFVRDFSPMFTKQIRDTIPCFLDWER